MKQEELHSLLTVNILLSAGFDSQVVITDTSDLDNLQTVKVLKHDDKVVSVKWHPFLPLLLVHLLIKQRDSGIHKWYSEILNLVIHLKNFKFYYIFFSIQLQSILIKYLHSKFTIR